jgi:hypothetical protein
MLVCVCTLIGRNCTAWREPRLQRVSPASKLLEVNSCWTSRNICGNANTSAGGGGVLPNSYSNVEDADLVVWQKL